MTLVTTELSGSDVQDSTQGPSRAPGGEVSSSVTPPRSGWEAKAGSALSCSLGLFTPLPLPELAQRSSKYFLKKREQ